MERPFQLTAGLLLWIILFSPTPALANHVHLHFDMQNPQTTLFPSDLFTVADEDQNTGLRVNMPSPDCEEQVSECDLLEVINTLDGFNLQPRLSIPFSGPIDVETVTSETVFLIHLGSTLADADDDTGKIIGINQVVWDPQTNTLHAESDEFLDQHTRYGLIVTRGVRSIDGKPIHGEAFKKFYRRLKGMQRLKEYRKALHFALRVAREIGVTKNNIAGASVFTTQSITSFLEKVRVQLEVDTPEPANFELGPDGKRTVFPLNEVEGIVITHEMGFDVTHDIVFSEERLKELGETGSQIAFGKYESPDYRQIERSELQTTDLVIPSLPTRSGDPQVFSSNEVFFNLFLPTGEKPPFGWPVAIFGHGSSPGKNDDAVFEVAANLAQQGLATIAINAVGHGGGREGTISVAQTTGDTVTLSAGGRSRDVDNDGFMDIDEGYAFQNSHLFSRDGSRQTAIDLMQLVRVIEVGIDVDGDGTPDLDASRLYYVGVSLGGYYGSLFLAVEPVLRAGVINVPLAATADYRLAPLNRGILELPLAELQPPLTNVGNPDLCDDIDDCDLRSDENLPLRNEPPVINELPGALAIQAFLEHVEWIDQVGSPVAYAAYLQKEPLIGQFAKPLIVQFARGDMQVPNASTTSLIRAGNLEEHSTLYQHDLVFNDPSFGQVPENPHSFFHGLSAQNPSLEFITLAAQQQVVEFFASDGTVVIDPDGPEPFFEVPINPPLPEDCGYVVEFPDFEACQ